MNRLSSFGKVWGTSRYGLILCAEPIESVFPNEIFIKPSAKRRFVGGAKLHIFNETTRGSEDMNLLSKRSLRTNVKNQSSHR
ncbi:hypothetical protein RISK_005165 [Rhodopirellula islandica]|uniref:Uncharacterized protein n=1 Tax=Rhodopirellula islandica TaxID=595434 RepID=A0A0J1EBB5_RHOIS|nr:hypothetical protein RISK_005165 [Rhodopirellula islandica]